MESRGGVFTHKKNESEVPGTACFSFSFFILLVSTAIISPCAPNWRHFSSPMFVVAEPGQQLVGALVVKRAGLGVVSHQPMLYVSIWHSPAKQGKRNITQTVCAASCLCLWCHIQNWPVCGVLGSLEGNNTTNRL